MTDSDDTILDNAYKVVQLEDRVRSMDAGDDIQPDQAELHYRPLGHHRGRFFFITARGKQVLSFPAKSLSQKANLFTLAPLQFWEREFPHEKGFTGKAVDQAVNYLVNACYQHGVFSLDRMRGLGAWWDDGRAVIHAGDRLIVEGQSVPLQNFASRYVYEALPALSVDLSDPLSTTEAHKLYAFATALNWEKPEYGTFFAGWATVATVCGALPWRPHMLITGQSGSGKTWVSKQLQRLLGEFVVCAKGNSSEAGLRQNLQDNAMPVLFDEAEGEDYSSEANINRVLGLMRQASSEDEGRILKGGADGKSASYTVRSMFCLSAVRNPIRQTADENRITVVTLAKNSEAGLEKFCRRIEPMAREIFTEEWTARFRARVIANLPTLRANIGAFAQAAGWFFASARMGDQVAPMLAGAYLLHSDKLISVEDAREWMSGRDWSEQEEIQDESDEDKVLTALLESTIRIPLDRGSAELSVGELIKAVARDGWGVEIDSGIAETTLARHGILVGDDYVSISNTHRAIKSLLRDTGWAVGWGRILKRIDGAHSLRQKKSFAGAKSRATSIPITTIFPKEST